MINANELRIGNTVSGLDRYWKVSAIFITHFRAVDKDGIDTDSLHLKLVGIPLTESILLKAGFTKHKNSNEFWNFWTLNNGWHIGQALHNEPSAGVETGYCYWGDDYIKVLHLHQLQNLYFALTGTELIINLEAQP